MIKERKKGVFKMFEKIKFEEKILNNSLVLEFEKLQNSYCDFSILKEKQSNKYLNNMKIKNKYSKDSIKIKKDVIKEFNNYKNLTYLKCKELERVSKEEELKPLFLTITLPSSFHPFRKNKQTEIFRINPNFKFLTLTERIEKGRKELNEIFREVYKNINKRENKGIKFIKIIEPHKSLMVHLHRILYVKMDNIEQIKKTFLKVIKKHKIIKYDFEELKKSKGSSYIIKYILKNFEREELRKFDGYRKKHKIIIFRMSNLELNTDIFKKLYYSKENKEVNKQVLYYIKTKRSKYENLYQYYTQNTYVKITKIDDFKEMKTNILNEKIKKLELKEIKFKEDFKFLKLIKELKEEFKEDLKKYENFKTVKIKKRNNLKTNLFYRFKFIKNVKINTKQTNKKIIDTIEEKTLNTKELRDLYYKNEFKTLDKKEINIIKKIKKSYKLKLKNTKEINKRINIYLINITTFKEDLKDLKQYKTKHYKIYDNLKKLVIYDKDDYVVEYIKNDY
jgi:hypothetical protein